MALFWNRNAGYGVMLNSYKGNYSLVSGKESEENGTQYKDWCYLSRWS